MKRLPELDYLRGLAAFGIMIFHYLSWTRGEFSADDTMGRIGIYGVAFF
jgi:peptidoglycan/LPS O-acetylase OafA/YrhL